MIVLEHTNIALLMKKKFFFNEEKTTTETVIKKAVSCAIPYGVRFGWCNIFRNECTIEQQAVTITTTAANVQNVMNA